MAFTNQFCAQEMFVLTAGVQKLQTILVESNELPAHECEGGGRKQTFLSIAVMAHII